jgi:hypothetical protein
LVAETKAFRCGEPSYKANHCLSSTNSLNVVSLTISLDVA